MRGEVSVPVEVRLGACRCVGAPHPDGDFVFLAPKLSRAAGHAAVVAIAEGGDLSVTMTAAIVRYSIVEWNFTDPQGKDVPVTPDNVDLYLPWNEGGKEVENEAFGLYMKDRENSPFYSRTSPKASASSSPPTPTASPTSPTPRSSSKRTPSSASPLALVSDGAP